MRRHRTTIIAAAMVLLGALLAVPAAAKTKTMADGEKMIVDPGSVVICNHDFIVENIAQSDASLKVVLGNKVYIDEIVHPGERLGYDLHGTIHVARFQGRENLDFNEPADIINLGPDAGLQVHCLSFKNNPLKARDPLTTFK